MRKKPADARLAGDGYGSFRGWPSRTDRSVRRSAASNDALPTLLDARRVVRVPKGCDTDAERGDLVEDLYGYLEATGELATPAEPNGWLGETQAVAADFAGRTAGKPPESARSGRELLDHVEPTGHRKTDRHIEAARTAARRPRDGTERAAPVRLRRSSTVVYGPFSPPMVLHVRLPGSTLS
ncbi:hypothetical protein BRC90_07480 [Halobacteriales archaeon QS_4_69_34]|nr:MAG: hypothetical protein BRC90_07480 [Halobacteriales archaeon QS_4_69_34]